MSVGAIVSVSPLEITTSEDIVAMETRGTPVPVTVQVEVTLFQETPGIVHHELRSVAAYTRGSAPSRENMPRDSKASSKIAEPKRIDFLFEEYNIFAILYLSSAYTLEDFQVHGYESQILPNL